MRVRSVFSAFLAVACAALAAVPEDFSRLDGARRGAYIRHGMQGLKVLALQHAPNAAGVAAPENSAFDTTTLPAVLSFHRRSGISLDGVVGSQTASALDRALGVQPPRGIRPRPGGATSGSALMVATRSMDRVRRESSILTELSRGNLLRRAGRPFGLLIAGIEKDVVISNRPPSSLVRDGGRMPHPRIPGVPEPR